MLWMIGCWCGPSEAASLFLRGGTIDTAQGGVSAAVKALSRGEKLTQRADAQDRSTWMVQFDGVIRHEWREAVKACGAEIVGYIPDNGYLIRGTPEVIAQVGALEEVCWLGEYTATYKQMPTLRHTLNARKGMSEDAAIRVLVLGFDAAEESGLANRVQELKGAKVESIRDVGARCRIEAWLTANQIETVTSWSDVEWVEEWRAKQHFNEKAMLPNMMSVTNVWQAVSEGGLGLTGQNEILAIADTGLDTGDANSLQADFQGRVTGFGWRNGAYRQTNSWADTDGHGTHVAGSAVGNGAASAGLYRGMAPDAHVVFQGVGDDFSGVDDLSALLGQAYTNGARLHSDSWGYSARDAEGTYNTDSWEMDQYVWDHPTFLPIVAAGNNGVDDNFDGIVDEGSVAPPSTAKNCLSVGASKNFRDTGGYAALTYGNKWPLDYRVEPLASTPISGVENPQGMCAFSSRGPCLDGRIKPDVVAPGTDVISVRSRLSQDTLWGIVENNTNYLYEGGTSMATPLTAGALVLLRQWLKTQGFEEPSAALMKGLLMNGARDMTPGQFGTGDHQEVQARPDVNQGHGHVDLHRTLAPGTNMFLELYDATNRLTQGAVREIEIPVGAPLQGTYSFTLAYSDYPPAMAAEYQLVNDLDIMVRKPSGSVLYPNAMDVPDSYNNVELIEFTADELGMYTVRLVGQDVPEGENGQPYALILRGPRTIPLEEGAPAFTPTSLLTNVLTGHSLSLDFYTFISAGGYPSPVLTMTTSADPNIYTFYSGQLDFLSWQPGTNTFHCTASNRYGTAQMELIVEVQPGPPQAPQQPFASQIGTTNCTATWDSVYDATNYLFTLSRNLQPGAQLLSESFDDISGTAAVILTNGWTGTKTFGSTLGSGILRVGSATTCGKVITPPLTTTTSVLSVVYQAASWTNDATTLLVGLSTNEGMTWTEQTVELPNELLYWTNRFENVGTNLLLRWQGSADAYQRFHLDNIQLYAGETPDSGAPLPGYPCNLGTATVYNVTGLDPAAAYVFFLQAQSAYGISEPSERVVFTTQPLPAAPEWLPFPTITAIVGYDTFLNMADYVTGVPSPTLTLIQSPPRTSVYSHLTGNIFGANPYRAGLFDFTFLASNEQGTAQATLQIESFATYTDIPDLTLTNATAFGFSATWTPCPYVLSYQLQIATNDQFTSAAAGGILLSNHFAAGVLPEGWTSSGDITFTERDGGIGYSLTFTGAGQYVCTTAVTNPASLTFRASRSQNATAWILAVQAAADTNGPWSTLASFNDIGSSWTERTVDLSAWSNATVYLRFLDARTSGGQQRYLDSVLVQDGTGQVGSLVTEVLTDASVRAYSISNLLPSTRYYSRIRMSDGSDLYDWSDIKDITTRTVFTLAFASLAMDAEGRLLFALNDDIPTGTTLDVWAADTVRSNAWVWNELTNGWSQTSNGIAITPLPGTPLKVYRLGPSSP